ncbi:MAG: DUF6176 family protein [bacterium]|nr:DUF6176 family protein [bacterium]
MTNAKLIKFKFKSGQKQVWLDWSEELKRRQDEVLATLKDEGVVSEACFISEDGQYVYCFMEAEDFEKVNKTVSRSSHPIDRGHKEARESSLDFVSKLECIFHFDNRG